jgi:rod shape determining protein RodA
VRPFERVSFQRGPQVDIALLVVIVAIATFGVVNLYSATSVYTDIKASFYVQQIYWIVVGFLLAIPLAAVDYHHFERLAPFLYPAGLVTLGLVFVLGPDIRGVARWIQFGTFTFQPSEFMKPIVVLIVARHIHNDLKTEPRTLLDLALPIGMTLIPTFAVMAQPDLGTSLIYLLSVGSMLAIVRIRRSTAISLSLLLVGSAVLLYRYGMKDYQKLRLESFLDPHADKTGTGYHAIQSQTAIGDGGLFGEGLMRGTQNQFGLLPDQYSDFPFAVYAEEWGFVGCLVLLGLYAFLCIWAVHVASQAKDRFGAALAVGIGSIVFWHTIFNVGMVLGVLPVVGVTLPLFSYGGSSVVAIMMGLGLLMNVSMRR